MSEKAKKTAAGAMLAFVVLCIAYFIPNFAQFQASPFATELMNDLSISQSQYSFLFSAPMLPAVFLALFAGLLIDRMGAKRVIGIALILTSLGCLVRVFSTNYYISVIATSCIGLTACFVTVGAAKILAGYFGSGKVDGKMGILMAAATLSTTSALATSRFLGTYQVAFMVSTGVSVVGCILWWIFIRDQKPVAEPSSDGTAGELPSNRECLAAALKSRNVWMTAIAVLFVQTANIVITSTAPMALASKGIDSSVASLLTSLFTAGGLIGCFSAPALARLIGRKKPVFVVYAALAGVCTVCFWFPSSPVLIGIILFLGGNFMSGLYPMTFALPIEFEEIGTKYAGTCGGVLTMMQCIGAMTLPSFVIIPLAGGNFGLGFAMSGASLLISAVLYFAVKMR